MKSFLTAVGWFLMTCLSTAAVAGDPVFDFDRIMGDPLEAKVLTTRQEEGVVLQEFEYTVGQWKGQSVRVYGILGYPEEGTNLPAIFWSQSGMYPATEYFPKVFAKKGYFCLNITLPHDVYDSFARFTTEDPKGGNITGLAIAQMRGITYMSQRPEVDPQRIGVSGSSYGGFFSSLIAGADPRVKAGMSFFTSGNHHLGTLYPQFKRLRTTDAVDRWLETIDPAWRLRHKKVPFLWAIAANDHWHHLPSAVQTYVDSIGEKRMSIVPNWAHAFPENIDQMLIDWFDVYMTGTRKPYNQPGRIKAGQVDGKLIASWDWSGDNAVKKAELVVSYGAVRPWHCWVYRYHLVVPARIDGATASAEIPVYEPGLEMLVYGNVTDQQDVVTSTVPITVQPDKLGVDRRTARENFNAALVRDFSAEEMVFLRRHGTIVPGEGDTDQKQAGLQSLRVEEPQATLPLKLGHVPQRAHRLTLWLRAEKPTTIRVQVVGAVPRWNSAVVEIIRRQYPGAAAIKHADIQQPVFTLDAPVDSQWREFSLDCPFDGMPVEGYNLHITQAAGGDAVYWIDTIGFEPLWQGP